MRVDQVPTTTLACEKAFVVIPFFSLVIYAIGLSASAYFFSRELRIASFNCTWKTVSLA